MAIRQKPSFHTRGDKRLLDEVVIADRSPAERDQHVGFNGLSASNRFVESAHRVGGDAEVDCDASAGFDNPRDSEVVRGDDLRGAKRSAGSNKLVAGRQNDGPRPPADRQIEMIGRSRQRHIAWGETPSGTNESLAVAEIESRRAQVFVRRNGSRDHDAVAVAPHVFLNNDRVGAFGHGRAGEDPRRLARPERSAEGAPGGGFADDGQCGGNNGSVRRTKRIAIHRRIGEGRLGAQREDVAGEHAAMRIMERDPLLFERGFGGGEHPLQRLLDGDHAAHGLVSLARHTPDLPPRFSTRRTASMVMPRSIALAMS